MLKVGAKVYATRVNKHPHEGNCSKSTRLSRKSRSMINILAVNWEGTEIARMLVCKSDKIIGGLHQIEQQIGVPPWRQRLVIGEHLFEENDKWSDFCVMDWSTAQLTILAEVCCVDFDLFYCDAEKNISGGWKCFCSSEVEPSVYP